MTRLVRGIALLPILVLMGCANPADDKPEAQVGEASHGGSHAAQGMEYAFDAASKIDFEGSKVTGSHVGGFKAFSGSFNLVDNDPTQSSVKVSIDTNSLWSDNDRLTGHLKSPDFFDVATHPEATFESTAIAKGDEGYTVTGNLMLNGVTKSITFPATIEVGQGEIMVNSEFFIKRFDFGIEYKGKADDLIRDEVVIKLSMVAKAGAAS